MRFLLNQNEIPECCFSWQLHEFAFVCGGTGHDGRVANANQSRLPATEVREPDQPRLIQLQVRAEFRMAIQSGDETRKAIRFRMAFALLSVLVFFQILSQQSQMAYLCLIATTASDHANDQAHAGQCQCRWFRNGSQGHVVQNCAHVITAGIFEREFSSN